MADPIVNFFKSTLVGTYSDTDTSITIATGDGALLPDPSVDGAFNLTIFEGLQVTGSTEFEIVRVTARSGDVLTVTRGAESTTPLTIGSATHSILMSATKKTFDDINTAIANVDLTTLTGVEELTFDSTGDEEFGLPVGTTAQRPSSPSAGYMRYNTTESEIEFFDGSLWVKLTKENYTVAVEYLVIAGGGGSEAHNSGTGTGGGGGGGVLSASGITIPNNESLTITVGAGGSAGDPNTADVATKGGNSSISSTTINATALGGGIGLARDSEFAGTSSGYTANANGGSGGGGSFDYSAGTGVSGQGFDGGAGDTGTSPFFGGGGGGAGEAGNTDGNGHGGDGVESSITGTSTHYGGGGAGGAGQNDTTIYPGGFGGGGDGGSTTQVGQDGQGNTGGGGGGCPGSTSSFNTSGAGGSGVVILRYPSDYTITIGAGLTGSETTVGSDKVATITAGTGNVSWSEA